jgi:phosphoribosylformimino-5-aminoimidazole carboxamide ribotide isomerase
LEIIPAIDIRGGRCVRLEQGDYDRETVVGEDPPAMARHWANAGARRLHVVDLDGAREGHPVNSEVIRAVIHAVGIPVQVGGGVRDISVIDAYLKAGADRVALGTAAVKDQTTLINAVSLFRERILVGVDARDGVVATEGWLEQSEVRALDLVQQLSEFGVARIFYTDINRDGLLTGPNFQAIDEIVEHAGGLPSSMAVIASGGVSEVEHLRRLAMIGVEGAIIGRALYTGALDLAEALAAVEE